MMSNTPPHRIERGTVESTTTSVIAVQVNFFGLINVTKAALPHLRRSPEGTTEPGDVRGRIINVSSAAGICAVPFADAWCR